MVTLDYQINASANDGFWRAGLLSTNSTTLYLGKTSVYAYNVWLRWPAVVIPAGATINVAYISMYYYSYGGTPSQCDLFFEDAANPSAPTSESNANSKTKTTNSIKIAGPKSGTWWNSASIVSIIQELVNTYNYASGAAMQALIFSPPLDGITSNSQQRSVDGNASQAPKLHIEYTPGSSSNAILTTQYRRRVS